MEVDISFRKMSANPKWSTKYVRSENRLSSAKTCNKMAACFTNVKMGSSVVEHLETE